MPAQTTEQGYIRFPDGAKVQIKASGEVSYTDIGAINSPITATLNYTENKINTANSGYLATQIRDMKIDGGFTLINMNPANIARFSGGMITSVATPGTEVLAAAFTNQVITTFVANTRIPLAPIVTATGSAFRFNAAPTITSVTASVSSVLAENNDYTIIADTSSSSGYSIVFNTAGTATVATTETITIVWGNNTPAASIALYCGSSTATITDYSLKFTHTDSAGLVRELEIFSVNTASGGLQFNFKGANEDGTEELPITFAGVIDTSLTDGRQLFKYWEHVGAA